MLRMTREQYDLAHKIIRHMSTHRMLNTASLHMQNPDMWRLYHRLCLASLRYSYFPKASFPEHYGMPREAYIEYRTLHLDGLASLDA